jgi:hypothetical protein
MCAAKRKPARPVQRQLATVRSPEGVPYLALFSDLGANSRKEHEWWSVVDVVLHRSDPQNAWIETLRRGLESAQELHKQLTQPGLDQLNTLQNLLATVGRLLFQAHVVGLLQRLVERYAGIPDRTAPLGRAAATVEIVRRLVLQSRRWSPTRGCAGPCLEDQLIPVAHSTAKPDSPGMELVERLLYSRMVAEAVAMEVVPGIWETRQQLAPALAELDPRTVAQALENAQKRLFPVATHARGLVDRCEVASTNGRASGKRSSHMKREWWNEHGPEIEQRLNGRAQTTEREFWEDLADGGEFIDQKTGRSKSASTLRKDYAEWLQLRDAPTGGDTGAN